MTATEDIKPCPFCGHVGIWVKNDGSFIAFAECADCNAHGPGVSLVGNTEAAAHAIAVEAWNERKEAT